MSVKYFSEDVLIPKIRRRNTSEWIKKTIVSEGKLPGDISFIFCSDEYLIEVNKKYLQHDFYTDIITFDYVDGDTINGDIFISTDRVRENAMEYSNSYRTELNRVLIHGVLHLLGYKDKSGDEKNLMTRKEDIYLKLLETS